MAVDVYWGDEEQTIVVYEMSKDWSWSEFYPVLDTALAMENSVTHRVDVIVKLPHHFRLPANTLTNVKSAAHARPENLHLVMIISQQSLITAIYEVAKRVTNIIKENFQVVPTYEDALAIIMADREKVTDTPE